VVAIFIPFRKLSGRPDFEGYALWQNPKSSQKTTTKMVFVSYL